MKSGLLNLVICTFGLYSTLTFAKGDFIHGKNYQIKKYYGRLDVQCRDSRGGFDQATFDCYQDFMLPTAFSNFIFEGSSANELNLKSKWETGEIVEKNLRFYPDKNQSSEVNLGINTLLQKALLGMGDNEISFQLKKNNKPQEQGNFIVNVSRTQAQSCQRGYVRSYDMNDCRFKSNSLCRQYLQGRDCAGINQ